jgi:hypothetical protein
MVFSIDSFGPPPRRKSGRTEVDPVLRLGQHPDFLRKSGSQARATRACRRNVLTHAALECRYVKTVELHDRNGALLPAAAVIGEVVDIFIDDAIIVDGRVDVTLVRPLARLGYLDYSIVQEVFEMQVFR